MSGRSPEAFAPQEHQRRRWNASERHHPREPLLADGANESVRPTHSRALSARRPLAAARPHAAIGTSRCGRALGSAQGIGQRCARSLELVHRHASRRTLAAHDVACRVRPTTDTPCALRPVHRAGSREGLWCLAGRRLYNVGLRGSFPDSFSALRALTFLCAPILTLCCCTRPLGACAGRHRIRTNRVLSKPWRLLERPQETVGAQDSHRCDVRLF
jgi:hypothetical protein